MASFTRGYSFGSREHATNEKLHRLVESATISGIEQDDFGGEIHGISTSAPASPTSGDLYYLHETSVSIAQPANSAWLHTTYLVRQNGLWVSLFGGDRLESGRFVLSSDFAAGGDIHNIGDSVLAEESGSQSATLAAGLDSNAEGKVKTLGAAITSASEPGDPIRIGLIGYSAVLASAQNSGSPWFDTLYNAAARTWSKSSASDNQGWHGFRLSNRASGAGGAVLQPAYLLGAMQWRS